MNPITWIKTYVLGVLADLREPFNIPEPDPAEVDQRPLPPVIPPAARAMLRTPEPDATTRVVAGPPRGSLRDRMQRAKERRR